MHTNLLTDLEVEKKRENLFLYQPLTKTFENFLKTFPHHFAERGRKFSIVFVHVLFL